MYNTALELGRRASTLTWLALTHPTAKTTPASTGGGCTTKYKVSFNLLDGATAPGLSSLQHGINIFAVVALLVALGAGIGGIVVMNGGSILGFRGSGEIGRRMIIGAVVGAFGVGALVTLINYAFSQGASVTC